MNPKDIQRYETEIYAIKQELESLPCGTLAKWGSYYFETNGSTRKGITKDPQKVRLLARKAYLMKRLQNLEFNLLLTKKHHRLYQTEEPIEIIRELPAFCQSMPIDCFFHPFARGWFESVSAEDCCTFDGRVYLTNSGIRVRSKSERTIADALDQYEIPYLYESKLSLGNLIRYPDFTINRPFGGELVLWEHFGRMDNAEYRKAANEKIALYGKYGFFPSENLICTYERDLLDPSRLHTIIELYLLR